MNMRQLTAALVVTSACILAACSAITGGKPTTAGSAAGAGGAGGAPTTTTSSAAPVGAADLPGLLLSGVEANAELGATAMAVIPPGPQDQMSDDSSVIPNKDCVVMNDTAESTFYTGTGYVAVHQQQLQDDPDTVLIYEQYRDDAALAAHRESPHFKKYGVGGLLQKMRERSMQNLVALI